MKTDGGQKQTRLVLHPAPPLPLIVWRVETQRRGIFDNSDSFPEGRADAWN